MARRSFVQIDGKLYDKAEPIPEEALASLRSTRPNFGVMPDLPEFRSPIDGKVYSGRSGLRDHCARHNVVPTADLAGLPLKKAVQEYQPDRAGIRDAIRRAVYK
jgi:hypothetical protein